MINPPLKNFHLFPTKILIFFKLVLMSDYGNFATKIENIKIHIYMYLYTYVFLKIKKTKNRPPRLVYHNFFLSTLLYHGFIT